MIAYTKQGSGTPVIFLHGFLGSRLNLKYLAQSLDLQRYETYLLDMPSHGESTSLPALTYPKLTEALHEFFKAEGIQQAVLVGHSMGGKTAMSFTLRYPKKVLGFMTLDISLGSHIFKQHQLLNAIKGLDFSWSPKDVRNYLDDCLDDDQALVGFILLNLKSTPEGFRWAIDLEGLLRENVGIWEEVELPNPCYPFEKPVSIICGENSSFCSISDRRAALKYFPNAQFLSMEKVGHFPHLENPDGCAAALKNLVERSEIYPLHLHLL